MIKKRQYHIWQYEIDNIEDKNGAYVLDYNLDSATFASETLMYCECQENSIPRADKIVDHLCQKNSMPV